MNLGEASVPTAKVLFRVPDGEGGATIETLWAFDLGNDEYRLDNIPFFACSVSCRDVVYAPFDEDEGFPTFQRMVRKSGSRTVRVLLDEPAGPGNRSESLLAGLIGLGCHYEGMNGTCIAVDVPPAADFDAVCNFLNDARATWEGADPSPASEFIVPEMS